MTKHDDAGIFWREFGSGPRSTLALHCSLGHSGAWRGLGAVMQDQLTLRCFDMPGHGRSAPCQNVQDFAETTYQTALRGLDAPRDVIGHSFGGVIALRLALEHPDLVRSLTLFEPVLMAAAAEIDPGITEQSRAFMEQIAVQINNGDPEGGARTFVETWGDGTPWDVLPSESRQTFAAGIPMVVSQEATVTEDCNGLLAAGRLEALEIPVTVVAGAASPPIIHSIQDVLVKRLGNAQSVTLEGVGHMGPITHPAEFAAVVAKTIGRT